MSCSRLLVMFVLLNFLSNTQELKLFSDMAHWNQDPAEAWGNLTVEYWVPVIHRSVLIILDVPDYTPGTEKTYVASGVLLDNSRILTAYNPFMDIETDHVHSEKIAVVLATGLDHYVSSIQIITGIVCARRIAYSDPDEIFVWPDKRHAPLHDLMILRMDEEIGVGYTSYHSYKEKWSSSSWFRWWGDIPDIRNNSLIAPIARVGDKINTPIAINSLVFDGEEELKNYKKLESVEYGEDDAPLVDCDEWLPRQWGFFICVRNIDNFSALSAGSGLFVRKTLFGIGSFAMFKNDTGILVFTDVRPYEHLINKTCGDEEFIP